MSGDVRAQILDLVPDPMDRVEAAGLLDDLLPPADLPATLRTVEDVAAVCHATGVTEEGGRGWLWSPDGTAGVIAIDGVLGLEVSVVDEQWGRVAELFDPTPTLVQAAIRAAQGGTQ